MAMADLGSIKLDATELIEAVDDLKDAIRYQGDNIAKLMDAASAEAEAITKETTKPDGGLYASSFGNLSQPTLQQHGYGRGDRVALFNGDGTLRFATTSSDTKRYVYSEKIPVDLDNGQTDAWPVKMVLKVDANTQQYIDLIQPVVFGKGAPPLNAKRDEWNAAALNIAVEEELVARFEYEKPPTSAFESNRPEPRTVKPVRFDGVSEADPRRQAIVAVDLELPSSASSRFRTFRLDRITSFVRTSEN